MTYWLSEAGEIYGCQQYKSFVLTKQLKIEQRYKKGCSIRYAIGDGKQSNAYMQNIMYATFVSHEYIETYYLCKCRRYKSSYFLGIWIHIALKRAIDFLYVHTRHNTLHDDDIKEEDFSWWHNFDNIDTKKILDTIKSERARYIIQRYMEGYTIKEIAQETQIASSSVSCSLSRSIKKLRDIYAE